jgi:hypothetical protein
LAVQEARLAKPGSGRSRRPLSKRRQAGDV